MNPDGSFARTIGELEAANYDGFDMTIYVAALRDAHPSVAYHKAATLGELAARSQWHKDAIRKEGGIPLLIETLERGFPHAHNAVGAICSLLCGNAENKVAIREAGGIEALVAFVESGRNNTIDTELALRKLAHNDDETAVAIALATGRVEAFVGLARRGIVFIGTRSPGRAVKIYGYPNSMAGAGAKRKAALVVAALLRDFPVPRDIKAVVASYL